jgi:Heterokaryon incompatibility protein (HET)
MEHSSIKSFRQHIKESFLLIDVVERKLAYISGETSVRYLALSYVWGRKAMPMLTKKNLAAWKSAKGLDIIITGLPKTIQDAIQLTNMLGERFLWVDSLCVIQDDHVFKSRLINKMNLIYENAFLTIFAAAGSDADAGLPGIREWSRGQDQPLVNVSEDLTLIYPISHSSLRESVWASRGWTYVFEARPTELMGTDCRSGTFQDEG